MQGSLTSDEIEVVLQSAVVGRIGCLAEGRVYVVPVSFAYDGQRILGHSRVGMKIEAMRANPDVCFEIDQLTDFANWQSVIAWGTYRELTGEDAAVAMGLVVDRLRPAISSAEFHGKPLGAYTPPLRFAPGGSTVVFAIELRERTGRFERQE